jgi:TonB family protein
VDRFRRLALIVVALAWAWPAGAQESLTGATLTTARTLYASAEYDRALAMLDGLLIGTGPRDERRSIELYRTLCLLAVGRTEDADRAIEGIVSADPMFRPTAEDIPPRMRQAFSDARRRLLPAIIQQRYAAAKTAFDRDDYAAASEGFQRVLDGLGDPDVVAVAAQPPLSDLRTLALGFHDLSAKLAAPRPEPAPVPAQPASPDPDPARIYTASHPKIVPPIVISQRVPPYPGRVTSTDTGVLEVVIDATGAVESATMRVSMSAAYDQHAINAAKHWRYRPARINGVPVKFRKAIQVALSNKED